MAAVPDPQELSSIPLFHDLKEPQLAKLNRILHSQKFPAETVVISMVHPAQAVYIIQRGSVMICLEHEEQPVILGILGAGEVLGELSVVDGLGHSANVVTLEECEFLWLDRADFLDCLRTMPILTFNLTSVLTRRMRLATSQIRSLATQDVYGRVARQILAFAGAYGYDQDGSTVIPLRLTQHNIAGLIGASRVRVNQVLGSFRRAQHISIDKNHYIVVHNKAALLELCK